MNNDNKPSRLLGLNLSRRGALLHALMGAMGLAAAEQLSQL